MNEQLVRKAGDSPVDNLINSTTPPALTTGVKLRKSQGILKRGTVLALSSAEDDMVILGTTAAGSETLTPNCILADTTDTGTTEAVSAVAYRAGHFNRPALIVESGYTMTRADEEALRNAGILMSDALA